jgi:hypothetical protein
MTYQSKPRSLELLSFTTDSLSEGNSYLVGSNFTGVANGNSKKVYIDNPDDGKDIVVLTPNVASNGQVYTNAVANPSVDTSDTSATVQNRNTSGDGLSATVGVAGDNETGVLSGGDAYPEKTIGGGNESSGAAIGVTASPSQIAALVEPGDTWAVSATNQSGSSSDVSIAVTLAEVDASII